jgi:hypothetical protein
MRLRESAGNVRGSAAEEDGLNFSEWMMFSQIISLLVCTLRILFLLVVVAAFT